MPRALPQRSIILPRHDGLGRWLLTCMAIPFALKWTLVKFLRASGGDQRRVLAGAGNRRSRCCAALFAQQGSD